MPGKLLIVEDEPIVALDLQQELEELGCDVTGLAESADAALMSIEESRPDLALMDIRIEGAMDGIQTARLIRHAYQIPVVFLTSYSDKATLARAARELPYGYLTKPFKSRELEATLSMALHKAGVDAEFHRSTQIISKTMEGVHEAIVFISAEGMIEFMNQTAEEMTGLSLIRSRGQILSEVFDMTDLYRRSIPLPVQRGQAVSVQEFGWFLRVPGGDQMIVDFSVRSVISDDGGLGGHVLALRDASERMRQSAIKASMEETQTFDNGPIPMVQLDGNGRVVRINQRFLDNAGLPMEGVVGRRLTDLIADPDPRITSQFIGRLLQPFRPSANCLRGA
jgi:PAS domain S-box-containing protein